MLIVGGYPRTYWQAPFTDEAPRPAGPLPLFLCLHGFGGNGSRCARQSRLLDPAPAAGFLSIFPDAVAGTWDDHGCGRRDGTNDSEFLVALIEHLVQTGEADPERIFVAGLSSGATMTERLLRTAIFPIRAAALVCGTARVASRDTTPIAAPSTPLLMFAGTRDPMVPYAGGNPTGVLGRHALRSINAILTEPGGHESVGPEQLVAEWAAVNGCNPIPTVAAVENHPEDPPIRRMTWSPATPEGAPIVYYRIDGGGHGWPSGKQYLPIKLIGMIPQHFDATRIVLDFACLHLGMDHNSENAPDQPADS